VITNAVIDEAMDRFMPKSASAATKALAEAVALERAKSGPVSMCRSCGVAATQIGAVKCTVCGAADFEVISTEMIERIAAAEGGLEEEATYDGRKLRWSEDARKGLWTMKNAYQRRRVKARVEKRARMMRLDAITLDFARQVIEEETGTPLEIQAARANGAPGAGAGTDPSAGPGSPRSVSSGEARLIARDDKKNPLVSTFEWTDDAAQRILRVPAGFMRNKTQERVEQLAQERAAATIDLGLVEEAIEIGKKIMAEVIANYPTAGRGPAAAAETPVSHDVRQSLTIAEAQKKAQVVPAVGSGYLNEVSSLTVPSKPGDPSTFDASRSESSRAGSSDEPGDD
jgi:hypothetical protein